jgi:hypothetical protein
MLSGRTSILKNMKRCCYHKCNYNVIESHSTSILYLKESKIWQQGLEYGPSNGAIWLSSTRTWVQTLILQKIIQLIAESLLWRMASEWKNFKHLSIGNTPHVCVGRFFWHRVHIWQELIYLDVYSFFSFGCDTNVFSAFLTA